MPKPITIENFTGGLSLLTDPKDNQFKVLSNFYYGADKRLTTRRGITTFGSAIGVDPISSYFFFQNDTTGARNAVCFAGTGFYYYNEGIDAWVNVTGTFVPTEANGNLTRWSFAVYKNIIYMCDGVNLYYSYDPATNTLTSLGTTATPVPTFDSGTDFVTMTAHGLNNGDRVAMYTTGAMPTGLDAGRAYFIINKTANTFQVAKTYNGSAVDFTTTGSGTFSGLSSAQPLCRYLRYMEDRVFGAGNDSAPSTLYYTAALPANANTISTNTLVVGGDELGRINAIKDMGSVTLAIKNKKAYAINIATPSATAIDSQNGGYSHRSVQSVENSIMYFTDEGIQTLIPRNGVSGGQALQSKSKTDDVMSLIEDVVPAQFNASAGIYVPILNNYYFTFDRGDDNVPETTLVYSSLTGTWTQYQIPSLYDYGVYIDSDGVYHYLIASANAGQMYEFETGFLDNSIAIEYELETKDYYFGEPGLWKTIEYIDLIGYKSEGYNIECTVNINGEAVVTTSITDDFLDISSQPITIGTATIGSGSIGGGPSNGSGLDTFPYLIRIPLYASGQYVNVNMFSNTGPISWTFEKMRIGLTGEVIEVFPTGNIG